MEDTLPSFVILDYRDNTVTKVTFLLLGFLLVLVLEFSPSCTYSYACIMHG